MEWAVHEVSLIFGTVLSVQELQLATKKAAEILFPTHMASGLMVTNPMRTSPSCPKDVVLKEIRDLLDNDITITEISTEFANQLIDILNERSTISLWSADYNKSQQIITFKVLQPTSKKPQHVQFVLITDTLPHLASQKARVLKDQVAVAYERTERLEHCLPHDRIQEDNAPRTFVAAHLNDESRDKSTRFYEKLNDVDFVSLQCKIMTQLYEMTNAETGFLIMQVPQTQEYVCHFVGTETLDEPICVDVTEDLFDLILVKNETAVHSDPSEVHSKTILNYLNFSKRISNIISGWKEYTTEQIVQSFLYCSTICPESRRVTVAVVLVNKRTNERFNHVESGFSVTDKYAVQEFLQLAAPLLRCALAYKHERKLKNQNESMLKVAGNIFTHMMDLTNLLLKIMQEARNLTNAERCSVFLLEQESGMLVAKVLDGLPTAQHEGEKFITEEGSTVPLPEEIRIAFNQGIAGTVATTGKILNIRDAYKHPLFYRGVDEQTGFKTRNILCFPIKNERDGVVGVAQLCNKIGFPYFTQADEDMAKAFSVFCCISIVHSLMYKHVQDAQHRVRLANELMTYHMKISEAKFEWLSSCELPPLERLLPNLTSFDSIPRDIASEDDSFLALMRMFYDLNLIHRWRLSHQTLARFILMVCRGYRNPAYHNWMHAFSVSHFVFICGKNLPLAGQLLSEIELLALFVASLCHDIDHRGTNNTFQVESKSVLAALYSSEGSVLERHHFSQTICILNTSECNIFASLTEQEYGQILDLLRDIILSTDLAHHLNVFPAQQKMINDGYDNQNPRHHKLLLALLMTAADLSDQTKNWRNTTNVARLIYEEFFKQGDLEKATGHKPLDSMDREQACIPRLQICFLDLVVIPLYETFVKQFPKTSHLLQTIHDNRRRWKCILDGVYRKELNANGLKIFQYDLMDELNFC